MVSVVSWIVSLSFSLKNDPEVTRTPHRRQRLTAKVSSENCHENPNIRQDMKHVERVRRFCLALPRTMENSRTATNVLCTQGVFAMFSINHHNDGHIAVTLPAAIGIQQMLIEAEPKKYYRPPYVAVAGWVGIELPRVTDKELRMHLREACEVDRPEKLAWPALYHSLRGSQSATPTSRGRTQKSGLSR